MWCCLTHKHSHRQISLDLILVGVIFHENDPNTDTICLSVPLCVSVALSVHVCAFNCMSFYKKLNQSCLSLSNSEDNSCILTKVLM